MKLEQNLGQLIMMGLKGPSLSSKERAFLKKIQPSGVIYFKRNIDTPRQIANLSLEVDKYFESSPFIGPLIGIDQEGGMVARLEPPFTVFPGNDFLGRAYLKTGRTTLACQQARAISRELKSIGVNLNFSPVADIHTNLENPIIGRRAFGEKPKLVADLVVSTVSAYKKENMICCVKHFPGHGDTSLDSHKALPSVATSKATLMRRELVPFQAAFKAGVPSLMTAHVVYQSLGQSHPATLSPFILGSFLRTKLAYHGIVISDDLEMNAIASHYSLEEAAVRAISSGVDLLLVCKSLDKAQAIYECLLKASQTGELPIERVHNALRRTAKLKRRYLLNKRFTEKEIPLQFGWPKHRELAQTILRF